MKRLAELDAQNPSIVDEGYFSDKSTDAKEKTEAGRKKAADKVAADKAAAAKKKELAECGMMPEMGMGMGQSSSPASISMTAGSGPELSGMLKDIMQLAGMSQHNATPLSTAPISLDTPAAGPAIEPGPAMRSVIDKLNPTDGEDDITQAMGDIDDDGDHDMDDHAAEFGDEEETDENADEFGISGVDNTPSDPKKPPPFKANQFANQENQPGQGDRMDGTAPKAYADMNEAVADLFAQYRDFVSEGKPSAGMSAKEKSSLAKKASAGKDIGKPGKSFDKVAAKAGGGEKGKKIAAAAMWKNAAKNESAKWRTHPGASEEDPHYGKVPAGDQHKKTDTLAARQSVSKTQSSKDPNSLAGMYGDKYAQKHGIPTKTLMKQPAKK